MKHNDQQESNEDINSELESDECDQQNEENLRQQRVRAKKAKQQFNSPFFYICIALLLTLIIYPRCSYKDNVRKAIDRQESSEGIDQKSTQKEATSEEEGMVPKF